MRKLFAIVVACGFLAACASKPPADRPDPSLQAVLQQQGLAMVVDGCVYHDNLAFKDFVVVDESYQVAKALQQAVTKVLAEYAIKVNGWAAPFACGSLVNSIIEPPPRVAQRAGDEPQKGVALPHVRVERLADDAEAVAAYRQLLKTSAPVLAASQTFATDYVPLFGFFARALVGTFVEASGRSQLRKDAEAAVLAPEQGQLLSKRLRARHVLVGLNAFKQESTGRRVIERAG
jgi:hypothetical protein